MYIFGLVNDLFQLCRVSIRMTIKLKFQCFNTVAMSLISF